MNGINNIKNAPTILNLYHHFVHTDWKRGFKQEDNSIRIAW